MRLTILAFSFSVFLASAHGQDDSAKWSAEVTRTLDEGSHRYTLTCGRPPCTVTKTHNGNEVGRAEITREKAKHILSEFFDKISKTAPVISNHPSSGAVMLAWKATFGERSSTGEYLKSEFGSKLTSDREKAVNAAASLETDLAFEIIKSFAPGHHSSH